MARNPAAWLTAIAKRKAIDDWQQADRLEVRYPQSVQNAPGTRTAVAPGGLRIYGRLSPGGSG